MDALARDIRYGMRSIGRSPGFSVVVVLTLALGIGANALVFAVVDGLVLNPFPFPEASRLVGVGTQFPRLNGDLNFVEHMSPAEYEDIRTGSRSLERVVAWDMGNRQLTLGDATENLFSGFWWGDALQTLGVAPIAGRGFTEEETTEGARVAILSHRVWRDRFASDPALVGGAVLMNGEPYTVVGIMPPGTLLYGMDLWLPMGVNPMVFERDRRQFQILARLAAGVSLDAANAELETIANRIEGEYGSAFEEYAGWRLQARTWTEINVSMLRPAAIVLMGAVGFVLLLVCANVASLLLARASGRQREMAIRSALGAGRGRVLRQLLTESVVLAALGGVAGGLLGWLGLQAVGSTLPALSLSVPAELAVNGRVIGFTIVTAVMSGVVFGMAPALQAMRFEPQRTLQAESQSVASSRARLRAQRVLVGIEVALAVLLVCGSALLVHSFLKLQRVDRGFDPKSVLTMRLTLPWEKYTADRIEPFFTDLRDRVAAIPGAVSVATASQYPPGVFLRSQLEIEGESVTNAGALPVAFTTIASPGYIETMRIPLVRGRTFSDADRSAGPLVAVINEAAAQQFFASGDALGRRIRLAEENAPWFEVVGIVRSTRNRGLDAPPDPEIFASSLQATGWTNQQFLLVRTAVPPRTLLPAIRSAVEAIDAQQPVYAIRTVEEAFALADAQRRVSATAITLFGMFALVLAVVGIYGVVSYAVSQRTREIGVRMALGAERGRVRGMVVRQAILPVVIGAAAGLAAAIAAGRLLTGLLFELSATDPLTLSVAIGVILTIALVAAWVPAARASRLSPVAALRPE
ncbi:MAG: ABC transporter permease [Longimicrobiales bacterium]